MCVLSNVWYSDFITGLVNIQNLGIAEKRVANKKEGHTLSYFVGRPSALIVAHSCCGFFC